MSHVLVVDDSATDRKLAGLLLQKHAGVEVRYAANGREAFELIREDRPDVVVSDLQMPEMNGLELVAAVRKDYPSVPVILMTARGSEEIAAQALRAGAASYVPKVALAQQLIETVERIRFAAEIDKLHSRLMHSLHADECRFVLHNDPDLIEPLAAHVQELLRCMPLADEAERMRVGIAVKHALWIGHYHGNLEIAIDSPLDGEQFRRLASERESQSPWADRSLELHASITRDEAVFTIRYEGRPIDLASLLDDVASQVSQSSWMGGYVVMQAIMDDIAFDPARRELSLLKKACAPEAAPDEFALADD